MTDEFSVYQFFPDGSYEQYVRRVGPAVAIDKAVHCATSVGARLGTTVRVIITDDGDNINWEWKWEEGIVFGASPEYIGKLKKGIRE